MNEEDIPGMTMNMNGVQVPLSKNGIRTISLFKHLIWKNMKYGVPGAKLASTYNQDMFDDYIDDINLRRKTYASYKISTSGLPALT